MTRDTDRDTGRTTERRQVQPAEPAFPTFTSPTVTALQATPIIGDRYRVEALLGTGGAGAVYRAVDLELDEVVALKLFSARWMSAAYDERIRMEVKLARRVTHPNVTRTFDLGDHRGTKFVTLEYVDGISLRKALAPGPLDLDRGIGLVASVCRGMRAIHDAGIVHRDLKPDNVLLGRAGEVKVTDFGIAVHAQHADDAVGTPGYMSPEQLAGAALDRRSDVYALGVMVFEIFSGTPPWIARGGLNAIARLSHLPRALSELVGRCLERDPARRPRDVGELLEVVDGLRAEDAPTIRTSGPIRLDLRAPSVAVADWATDHDADRRLAQVIGGELIRELSAVPGLNVRQQLLARRDADVQHDAAAAGVDVVVDGTVARTEQRFRIALHLVSASDGVLLWARAVESSTAAILGDLADAAGAIAHALAMKPAAQRPVALRDPVTIDLYLRSVHGAQRSVMSLSLESVDLAEQALARSPDDPLLLSQFAHAWSRTFVTRQDLTQRALAAAERGVQLAPHLVEAQLALAACLFVQNELPGAVRALRYALELAPSSSQSRSMLGTVLAELGRTDDGIAQLQLSQAIDPSFDIARFALARVLDLLDDRPGTDALLHDPEPTADANEPWMHWMYKVRVALRRDDPAYTAELLDTLRTRWAHRNPLLGTLCRVLAREGQPRPLLAPIENMVGFETRLRARMLALELLAEACIFLGDLDLAEQHVERLDRDSAPVDWLWIDGCTSLRPLLGRPKVVAVRDRIARRRDTALATIDSTLGPIVLVRAP